MCIVPKNKKPQTRDQLITAREPECSRKGYELPANIRQPTGNSGNQKQPRVGDVHRKLKTAEMNLSLEEQKRQLMLAQEAMGLKPNTTIIEKIAERQKKLEATQDASVVRSVIQSSSKMGDIQYSLFKKPKKDDDTLCPDVLKGEVKEEKKEQPPSGGCNTPNPEEELLNEDEEVEEPNSENYMYNQREIIYTCHTMVRTMGNLDQSDYGEGNNDPNANVRWDPFAALEELQTREFTF
uniref:Uncharacterized protein n=1 Tax=Panagrolaimus sp. JU765 TaxID=591449 RepID=A0AC34QM33_9BILA